MDSILKCGNKRSLKTEEGTLVHIAMGALNEPIVNYLIENDQGINWTAKNENGENVIFLALSKKFESIFQKIVEHLKIKDIKSLKLLINETNNKGNHILHELAHSDNNSLIDFLLK